MPLPPYALQRGFSKGFSKEKTKKKFGGEVLSFQRKRKVVVFKIDPHLICKKSRSNRKDQFTKQKAIESVRFTILYFFLFWICADSSQKGTTSPLRVFLKGPGSLKMDHKRIFEGFFIFNPVVDLVITAIERIYGCTRMKKNVSEGDLIPKLGIGLQKFFQSLHPTLEGLESLLGYG